MCVRQPHPAGSSRQKSTRETAGPLLTATARADAASCASESYGARGGYLPRMASGRARAPTNAGDLAGRPGRRRSADGGRASGRANRTWPLPAVVAWVVAWRACAAHGTARQGPGRERHARVALLSGWTWTGPPRRFKVSTKANLSARPADLTGPAGSGSDSLSSRGVVGVPCACVDVRRALGSGMGLSFSVSDPEGNRRKICRGRDHAWRVRRVCGHNGRTAWIWFLDRQGNVSGFVANDSHEGHSEGGSSNGNPGRSFTIFFLNQSFTNFFKNESYNS